MENVPSVDELVAIVIETVRRNGFREDAYIRPSFYKSTQAIGVRLHHLDHQLYVITVPFGNYVDVENRRPGHDTAPGAATRTTHCRLAARSSVRYVNSAFHEAEASSTASTRPW